MIPSVLHGDSPTALTKQIWKLFEREGETTETQARGPRKSKWCHEIAILANGGRRDSEGAPLPQRNLTPLVYPKLNIVSATYSGASATSPAPYIYIYIAVGPTAPERIATRQPVHSSLAIQIAS
jgi:hypothetical protein